MLPWPDRRRQSLAWWLVGVAIAVLAASFWHWRVVADASHVPDRFGTRDLFTYFFPMIEHAWADVRAGRLFLWNPYQLAGVPGLATWQAGLLYPPHLVYAVVPTHVGMALMAVLHVTLAGWNMALLARVLGARPSAALAAGLYYAFTTVTPWYVWPPGMEAAAWLPLGIAAIQRVLERPSLPWLGSLVAAVALPLLSGGYQTSAYMLAAYGGFALLTALRPRSLAAGASRVARDALRVGACTAVGIALAAPQLLPTLELTQHAARSTTALTPTEAQPFINLLVSLPYAADAALLPPAEVIRLGTYVGVLAAGLALAGLLTVGWPAIFCATLILYGILSALTPPWFLELRASLPVLGWFRLPVREAFLAHLGIAMLVAAGLTALLDSSSNPVRRNVAAAGAAACMLIGCVYRGAGASALVAVLGALLVCAATLWTAKRIRGAWAVGASLALLLVYDTVGIAWNDLALPYARDGWRAIYATRDVYERVRELAGPQRALVSGTGFRFDVKNAQIFGLFSPFDYEPLAPAAHEQCFLHADPEPPQQPRIAQHYFGEPILVNRGRLLEPPLKRCLDLLSVRLAAAQLTVWLSPVVRSHWTNSRASFPVDEGAPPYIILENPDALPRAFAVYAAECLETPEEQWQRLVSPSFDPRRAVVLDRDAECRASGSAAARAGPDVEVVGLDETRVRLRATLDAPGYIVLTDTFYPGWGARVNGKPETVLRANGVSRAVRVPEGRVEVVFEYLPVMLYSGILVAALALLLVATLGLRWRRSRGAEGTRRAWP